MAGDCGRVTFCYSLTSSVTLERIAFGCVHKFYTHCIGSCVPPVRQLVTENGLILYASSIRRRLYVGDRFNLYRNMVQYKITDVVLCLKLVILFLFSQLHAKDKVTKLLPTDL